MSFSRPFRGTALVAGTALVSGLFMAQPAQSQLVQSQAQATRAESGGPASVPPPMTIPEKPRPGVASESAAAWNYKYASTGQHFNGRSPGGVTGTFTVHRPKQVGRNQHSLVEIAVTRVNPKNGRTAHVEVGVNRTHPRGKPQLFVFWWGMNGAPHCYDMRCKGFVRAGKGIRPGKVLKPGTKIRLGIVRGKNRWVIKVNGKVSGFYPDRLWKGRFKKPDYLQVFGEVTHQGKIGRCVDMGNGRHARKKLSARVTNVRYKNKSVPVRLKRTAVTRPKQYSLKITGPRSFRYGGPGPC